VTGRRSLGLVVLSGVAGAAGVMLAAVAAHRVQSPALASAAQMLMVHAAACVAVVALSADSQRPGLWLASASLLVGGALLFAAAVALPPLAGLSLFPMAAPIGGGAVIAGWIGVAVAAALGNRR
jgi:uncharacterized membrane protein YgdD (TMEM256/DUF423 family)